MARLTLRYGEEFKIKNSSYAYERDWGGPVTYRAVVISANNHQYKFDVNWTMGSDISSMNDHYLSELIEKEEQKALFSLLEPIYGSHVLSSVNVNTGKEKIRGKVISLQELISEKNSSNTDNHNPTAYKLSLTIFTDDSAAMESTKLFQVIELLRQRQLQKIGITIDADYYPLSYQRDYDEKKADGITDQIRSMDVSISPNEIDSIHDSAAVEMFIHKYLSFAEGHGSWDKKPISEIDAAILKRLTQRYGKTFTIKKSRDHEKKNLIDNTDRIYDYDYDAKVFPDDDPELEFSVWWMRGSGFSEMKDEYLSTVLAKEQIKVLDALFERLYGESIKYDLTIVQPPKEKLQGKVLTFQDFVDSTNHSFYYCNVSWVYDLKLYIFTDDTSPQKSDKLFQVVKELQQHHLRGLRLTTYYYPSSFQKNFGNSIHGSTMYFIASVGNEFQSPGDVEKQFHKW